MSSFRPAQRSDKSLLSPREEMWPPRPLPAPPPGPRLHLPSLRHQPFRTAWLLPRAIHLAPAQGTSLQGPCSARKAWTPASAGLHAASSQGLLELRGPARGRLSLLVACHVPTSPSRLANPAAGACRLGRHRVGEGPCSLALPAHGSTVRRCLGAAEARECLASRPLPLPGPAHLHLPESPPLSRFCSTFLCQSSFTFRSAQPSRAKPRSLPSLGYMLRRHRAADL